LHLLVDTAVYFEQSYRGKHTDNAFNQDGWKAFSRSPDEP
jgi:hypothetical protein